MNGCVMPEWILVLVITSHFGFALLYLLECRQTDRLRKELQQDKERSSKVSKELQ